MENHFYLYKGMIMKNLMLISAMGVIAVLYSTGLFVPETRGVEKTFAGLTILSDAEMAYQVGGPIDQPRRPSHREEKVSATGNKANCPGASGNCGSGPRPHCNTKLHIYNEAEYKCTPCDSFTWDYTRYQYKYVKSPVKSWCINRSDGCFYRWMPGGKIRTCDDKVSDTCRPDLAP